LYLRLLSKTNEMTGRRLTGWVENHLTSITVMIKVGKFSPFDVKPAMIRRGVVLHLCRNEDLSL